jgi:hypothetical protein
VGSVCRIAKDVDAIVSSILEKIVHVMQIMAVNEEQSVTTIGLGFRLVFEVFNPC